jgi:glutathione S-transferase
MAKMCLLEKGLPFEEVRVAPSQDADFRARSPMGRIPYLETPDGYLSETLAIAEWLDATHPQIPLIPVAPFVRAKTIELIRHIELDVELVARRCLPAAFFGGTASDETQTSTRADLAKGMRAVDSLMRASPWAAGDTFTLADVYTYYTFTLSAAICRKMWNHDLLGDYTRIGQLMQRIGVRESVKRIEADRTAG